MPYKDPQKAREYARQYAREHKEQRLIYSRVWRKKNPERAKAIWKKSREKHIEKRKKHSKEYLIQQRKKPEFMFKQYESGAKQRNYKWRLTFNQFMTFWRKPCCYCGKKIETIGLDRIDNDRGYLINNVVSCCSECNLMKHKLNKNNFINQCKKIVQFQPNLKI